MHWIYTEILTLQISDMKSLLKILPLSSIISLAAGVIAFFIPLLVLPDTIAPDLQIACGLFLIAAIYYIAQPVPIYATSLLVMFGAVLTLTTEAPFQPGIDTVQQFEYTDDDVIVLPDGMVYNDAVFTVENGIASKVPVTVLSDVNGKVTVQLPEGREVSTLASDAEYAQRRSTALMAKDIFATMASPIIILFLGGFMLARGAVKYNLDTNLTRILLKPFGEKPSMIMMGLMAITALLSAFMSNTATTAMMMTMIIPIISKVDPKDKFKVGAALSIPVAANIGGMATPIGTPPNAIVIAGLNQRGIDIAFSDWMMLATPVVLILLVVSWVILRFMFKADIKQIKLSVDSIFDTSIKAIGLYVIFGLTVILWITENQHGISSSMVAFFPVTFLSLTTILDKEDIRSLPWEVLWLVAGGIALGLVINQTGLAKFLISLIDWNLFTALLLIFSMAFLALMMSNFLSNTVTAALLVPIGISIGLNTDIAGYNFIIGAIAIGLASSCAMLLPISTPPNAIAISTNLLDTRDMTKFGIVIGIVAIIVLTLASQIYWPLFF